MVLNPRESRDARETRDESRNLASLARLAEEFPVALPEGYHPFPYRTRKLSPPGSMLLLL